MVARARVVEPLVVEATAAVANPDLAEAHFWQALLAADISASQRRAFFDHLLPSVDRLAALRSWSGLTTAQRARIDRSPIGKVERALAAGVVVLSGDLLPTEFRSLENVPKALFAWGDTLVLDAPCVSVVGTRRASSYGRACAYKFGYALAQAGATVVSGGALGVDTEAHKGALAAGGKTAAVFGTGIDKVYPSSNSQLYESIRASGVLISPFAIGTPSMEHNFLRRNPVIAALSPVLLVIEAPERSGSLSTATAASEYGKEVYVVPGPITLPSFRGSHQLIREGATLVDHPDTLLEILGLEAIRRDTLRSEDPTAQLILACLDGNPRTGDSIVLETGLDTSEVLTALTLLEIDGTVKRDGSGYILN